MPISRTALALLAIVIVATACFKEDAASGEGRRFECEGGESFVLLFWCRKSDGHIQALR